MAYLEIETRQGSVIVDHDRITGIGEASGDPENNGRLPIIVVLLLTGDHVDLILHNEEQAKKLLEEVRKILIQRKIRQPSKPILIGK